MWEWIAPDAAPVAPWSSCFDDAKPLGWLTIQAQSSAKQTSRCSIGLCLCSHKKAQPIRVYSMEDQCKVSTTKCDRINTMKLWYLSQNLALKFGDFARDADMCTQCIRQAQYREQEGINSDLISNLFLVLQAKNCQKLLSMWVQYSQRYQVWCYWLSSWQPLCWLKVCRCDITGRGKQLYTMCIKYKKNKNLVLCLSDSGDKYCDKCPMRNIIASV